MSRIGKNPIVIPAGVTVEVKWYYGRKNGQLTQEFSDVTFTVEDSQVQVDRSSDHKTKDKTWFVIFNQ
jgi:large subunit ribosomal protein L6